MSEDKEARLVRGMSYTYRGVSYTPDKWMPVTEEVYLHLVENAVDNVTVSGGGETRPSSETRDKFEFRAVGSDAEAEEEAVASKTAPRRRRR